MATYVDDLKRDLNQAFERKQWETVHYVLGKLQDKGVDLPLTTQETIFLKLCDDMQEHRVTGNDRLMALGLVLRSLLNSCERLTEKARSSAIATVSSILVDLQLNHIAYEQDKPESELLILYKNLDTQVFDKTIQSDVPGILDVTRHMVESCLSFFQKDKLTSTSVEVPIRPELR